MLQKLLQQKNRLSGLPSLFFVVFSIIIYCAETISISNAIGDLAGMLPWATSL